MTNKYNSPKFYCSLGIIFRILYILNNSIDSQKKIINDIHKALYNRYPSTDLLDSSISKYTQCSTNYMKDCLFSTDIEINSDIINRLKKLLCNMQLDFKTTDQHLKFINAIIRNSSNFQSLNIFDKSGISKEISSINLDVAKSNINDVLIYLLINTIPESNNKLGKELYGSLFCKKGTTIDFSETFLDFNLANNSDDEYDISKEDDNDYKKFYNEELIPSDQLKIREFSLSVMDITEEVEDTDILRNGFNSYLIKYLDEFFQDIDKYKTLHFNNHQLEKFKFEIITLFEELRDIMHSEYVELDRVSNTLVFKNKNFEEQKIYNEIIKPKISIIRCSLHDLDEWFYNGILD